MSMSTSTSVSVYTDGSCKGNPGPGAFAYLIREHGRKDISFAEKVIGKTTNNIAELQGIYAGLNYIVSNYKDYTKKNINVYTDSKYCIGVISQNWKINKNQELITAIKKIVSFLIVNNTNVNFEWVRGHNGDEGNEIVNKMAQDLTII